MSFIKLLIAVFVTKQYLTFLTSVKAPLSLAIKTLMIKK